VVGRQPNGSCASWRITVARAPLTAATVAPVVGIDNSASQHRAVLVEALADDGESELVESAETGQISAAKPLRVASITSRSSS
jgi:hypothetical protein